MGRSGFFGITAVTQILHEVPTPIYAAFRRIKISVDFFFIFFLKNHHNLSLTLMDSYFRTRQFLIIVRYRTAQPTHRMVTNTPILVNKETWRVSLSLNLHHVPCAPPFLSLVSNAGAQPFKSGLLCSPTF